MKIQSRFCSFLLFVPLLGLQASDPTCFESYLKRSDPNYAVIATECWKSADYPAAERQDALSALGWVARKSESREIRMKSAQEGFALAARMELESDVTASFWSAVFVSFEAQALDDGNSLPRNMLRAIPTLRKLLRRAIETSPQVQGYGPARVLGILELSLPAILKGSAKEGASLIDEAYRNAPTFPENILWQAKAWARFKRTDEAKELLERFISKPSPQNENERLDFEDAQIQARAVLESFQ